MLIFHLNMKSEIFQLVRCSEAAEQPTPFCGSSLPPIVFQSVLAVFPVVESRQNGVEEREVCQCVKDKQQGLIFFPQGRSI